ncbi:MAG: hypothetical protein HYU58_08795 [Proteobacteria bacterium]|nr:hypothetical protein [Pseudomonadota bacterium]
MTSLVAAIRGDICTSRPAPRAVDAVLVYRLVGRHIGMRRLAGLWQDYRGSVAVGAGDPRGFAAFLGQQEEGRAEPALADLARLDLAFYLAGMVDREPSIGTCCLSAEIIANHMNLVLRLQPSFRYLPLRFAVHEWQGGALPAAPAAEPLRLRLSPGEENVRTEILAAPRFVFESALARGVVLLSASAAALNHTTSFDAIATTLDLVAAGAVADVMLHPKG